MSICMVYLVVSKQIIEHVLGILSANQVRVGHVNILPVNAMGRDWSDFVHQCRSHLNHQIAGCRTGLARPIYKSIYF